jgi:hypothetical protein
MDFLYGETLTILSTVTTRDDYGNESTDETEVSWGPCALAPRSSDERVDPHSPAVVTALTAYGPAADLDADDTVRIDAGFYAGIWQVEGIPGDWKSPFTGWHPGLEVALKRAT